MSAIATVIFIALAALVGVIGLAMLVVGIVLLVRSRTGGGARGVGLALTIVGAVLSMGAAVFGVVVVMQVVLGVHLIHF